MHGEKEISKTLVKDCVLLNVLYNDIYECFNRNFFYGDRKLSYDKVGLGLQEEVTLSDFHSHFVKLSAVCILSYTIVCTIE